MHRREVITLLSGAVTWPLTARAQQAGKLPTIGVLGPPTASVWAPWIAAFEQRVVGVGSRACAAGGGRGASTRSDRRSRRQFRSDRGQDPHRGVPGGTPEARVGGGPQHPHRHALRDWLSTKTPYITGGRQLSVPATAGRKRKTASCRARRRPQLHTSRQQRSILHELRRSVHRPG